MKSKLTASNNIVSKLITMNNMNKSYKFIIYIELKIGGAKEN